MTENGLHDGNRTDAAPKKLRRRIFYDPFGVENFRGLVRVTSDFLTPKAIGFLHVLAAAFLCWILYSIWPVAYIGDKQIEWYDKAHLWSFYTFVLTKDQRLLLIVMISGAIGSFVHSATSFASYIGSRTYAASWAWWYVLRIPIGSLLAVTFYFVFRGGFLGSSTDTVNVSPYGVAALSALAGMFSKQAIDKLEEVFDNMFKTERTDGRRDKLNPNDKQNSNSSTQSTT